jgi:3-dehydroquinate dehydratase type I
MKLCLVIYEKKLDALLRNIDLNMLTEVRLDFSNFKDQEIAIIFRHSKNLIATYRENNRTTHEQRIQSLKVAIQNGAAYVDIDFETPKEDIEALLKLAKKYKCKTIISHHNYIETPHIKELSKTCKQIQSYSPDIMKIITKTDSVNDLKNLMALYAFFDDIIALGIGKLGGISRVIALAYEAPFIFTFSKSKYKVVNGQISQKILEKLGRIFKGV